MTDRHVYSVYGEGAVWTECELDPETHSHPQIHREDWPSRRAYLKARAFRWLFSRVSRYWRPSWRLRFESGPVDGWLGPIARRAFPRVPTVRATIPHADSIHASSIFDLCQQQNSRAADDPPPTTTATGGHR